MVDTIHLQVKDFKVERYARIRIYPGYTENRSGKECQRVLWYPIPSRGGSKPVTGIKAIYDNQKFFSMHIYQPPHQPKPVMAIRITAPKRFRADNFYPVTGEDLPEVFNCIEKELRGAGIHCCIQDAKVMRLDLTRNFITEQEPRDYLRALRFIEKARLRKEKWGTTLLLKNTQQEICLYDKIAELKSEGVDTRQYSRNVIRIEQRLMKHRKIKSALDIITCRELLDNFSRCSVWYQKNLAEQVFYLTPGNFPAGGLNDLKSKMTAFRRENGSRNWFKNFTSAQWIGSMHDRFPEAELLQIIREVEAGDDAEVSPKEKHRLDNKIGRYRGEIKAAREFQLLTTGKGLRGKSDLELYAELKEMVLCK